MEREKILLYSLPAELHRQIANICREMGVECKKIVTRRYNEAIGLHAGVLDANRVIPRYDGGDLPEPMIVFFGMNNLRKKEFINECDKLGIGEGIVKTMVTTDNMKFNPMYLYAITKKSEKAPTE